MRIEFTDGRLQHLEVLGLSVTRKGLPPMTQTLSSRGWFPIVREHYPGAWQNNDECAIQDFLSYAPVYACLRLISSDIGKLRVKLVRQIEDAIWVETVNPAFSPVLRKPNRYQTRIEFYQNWITSKLIHGNTYVLKQRNDARKVEAMYILDPTRVKVLIAPDGDLFYQLSVDNLAGLQTDIAAPASEIIHDKMVPLYHPLSGLSPLIACALPALTALKIQKDSSNFFANGSQPSGVLTSKLHIKQEVADELKERWEQNYGGANVGRIAILGDDLHYEPMRQNAVDSQLIEQLKMTGENVCTAFGVPPYKIGIGPPPNYNNIEALNQQYYSECLQVLIETIEILLDEGLGMSRDGAPQDLGTEFEVDDLLRMDTATRVKAASEAVGGGGMTINEARKKYHGLESVDGGDTVYLQQQNWPIKQLSSRPLSELAPVAPSPTPEPAVPADPVKTVLDFFEKRMAA